MFSLRLYAVIMASGNTFGNFSCRFEKWFLTTLTPLLLSLNTGQQNGLLGSLDISFLRCLNRTVGKFWGDIRTFIHTYIHICCCSFRCSGTGKRYSNRKETSCVPLLKAGFEPGIPDTKSPADWMFADKPIELSRINLKTWTRQPVPMISEHSAHLTPLSVDFRIWLWRYTYLLLLISMLWHRQAIFESKGDKLCSSAESRIWTRDPRHQIASRLNTYIHTHTYTHSHTHTYLFLLISMLWHRQAIFESNGDKLSSSAEGRIRTQRVSDTYSPADWMPADKPTELSRIKLKTWTRQPVPMISKHSAHLTPLPFGIRTWLWRYTYLLLLISMLWHRQAILESKRDKLSSSAEGRIRTHTYIHTYIYICCG